MIDPADKQTQALPLEQPKRGRGRPATGAAMTPAEKQKAYRERQKAKHEEIEREMHNAYATSRVDESVNEDLYEELESSKAETAAAIARAEQAETDFVTLRKKLDKALQTIQDLKKGNVTRIKRHRDDPPIAIEEGIPDDGIWTIEFMMKGIGKRSWDTCTKPQIDFEGVPDKFEMVKRHVDDMNRKEVARNVWRAVRDDGLIYEPKAPKSKRKQPAKS